MQKIKIEKLHWYSTKVNTTTANIQNIKYMALHFWTIFEHHKMFILVTSLQALRAWILEFEMSVHRICEFDPFWTKKKFLQKATQTDGRTDRRKHAQTS